MKLAHLLLRIHTFRIDLHMNQLETRCPCTGYLSNHITHMTCDIYSCQCKNILANHFTTKRRVCVFLVCVRIFQPINEHLHKTRHIYKMP